MGGVQSPEALQVSYCSRINCLALSWSFPGGSVVRNSPAEAGNASDKGFCPWVGEIPWSRKWQPTPVPLSGKLCGQRNLVDYGPLWTEETGGLQSMRSQRVGILATPWTAAHQAPPSVGFFRQEHWSGLPLPSPPHSTHSTK